MIDLLLHLNATYPEYVIKTVVGHCDSYGFNNDPIPDDHFQVEIFTGDSVISRRFSTSDSHKSVFEEVLTAVQGVSDG